MATKTEIDRNEILAKIAEETAQAEHEEATIAAVTKAIRDAKKLVLSYVDARGQKSSRLIEPRGLARSKAGDLSVLAWDLGKQDFRKFRSDRLHVEGALE